MKKLTGIFLSLCLVLSLFAACGEKKENPEATATTNATATTKATATAKATDPATAEPTAAEPTAAAPTAEPDPEVDAMLFRFWTEDEFGWENIRDAAAVTGLPEASLILAAELEYAEGAGLKITPQTQDPYFFIVPSSDTGESFSFAEYPILKIRMKNESPSELGELYIATNGQNVVSADDKLPFEITPNDTEFKEYIVDLKELKGEEYVNAGNVSALRVDAVNYKLVENPTAEEAYENGTPFAIYIDYFGFFKTVADAQAWNPAHVAK